MWLWMCGGEGGIGIEIVGGAELGGERARGGLVLLEVCGILPNHGPLQTATPPH